MEKGKLIVLEGCGDGIGKSTQLALLRDRLLYDGYEIYSHHFPSYGTYQAKPVEEYLYCKYGATEELSPYFINALYALDRAVTWYTELKEQYEQGKTILLDRYTTSSLIYQAALYKSYSDRRRFINYVLDYEYNKLGIQEPDMTLFLMAPWGLLNELRRKRAANDGIENDIHERNQEFLKKVYDNSMFMSEYLDWDTIKCNNNDQMRSIDSINDEIYTLVKKKMTKH